VIELYHTNMSVCSQKVRFALAEKKLRWEDHHINLQAGEQLRPEYLKLNPNAVVPTLVDNGTVIIESLCSSPVDWRLHTRAVAY